MLLISRNVQWKFIFVISPLFECENIPLIKLFVNFIALQSPDSLTINNKSDHFHFICRAGATKTKETARKRTNKLNSAQRFAPPTELTKSRD